MKRFLKLWELLLVFMMMLIAFFNPTLADNQQNNGDNGSNNSTSSSSDTETKGVDLNQNQVAVLNVEDIVGKDQVSKSSETELTTTVPAVVDIVIVGPGSVSNGGRVYGNNNRIKTTNMTFVLTPSDGYHMSEVYWNSMDVTSLAKTGVLKLRDIESGVLKVRYVENSPEEPCDEECCCPECGGKCSGTCKYCKGTGKCKKRCSVSTGDNTYVPFYCSISMMLSALIYVMTLNNEKLSMEFADERRYRTGRRVSRGKYGRLRA